MFRKMVVNGVLFVLVCHVFNDLSFIQCQYWATVCGLIGVSLNAAID